ncbi:MAG TPA: glycosyltransferase [Firmicutes bacterium]|nr:glycosyltransferase [Bacillota bacterium]
MTGFSPLKGAGPAGPEISVIIPTFNRRPVLLSVLAGFADQLEAGLERGEPCFEVIVVDDGSTDDTREAVTAARGSFPYPLRLLPAEHGGPGKARNLGIMVASAPILLFVDSDLIPGRRLVAAHLAAHRQHPRAVVHGPVIQVRTLDVQVARRQRARLSDLSRAFFAGGNVSIRKEYLLRAGLFDEELSRWGWWEDLELGERLRALPAGPGERLRVVRTPGAAGYHYKPPLTADRLPCLCEREAARAKSALVFYRKHPTLAVRRKIPLSRVAFALDRLLAAGGWPEKPWADRWIARAEKSGRGWLFRILAWVKLQHAYFGTLRREWRAYRRQLNRGS